MATLRDMTPLQERIDYLRRCTDEPTSYAAIARAAGISQSAVAQAATGLRIAPTMRTLMGFARAYRAPLDWIASGHGPRPSKSLVRAAVAGWRAP